MYSAISAQLGVAKQLDIIANNLANANTAGFRAERPLFERLLKQSEDLTPVPLKSDLVEPESIGGLDFNNLRGTYTDQTTGGIEVTGNALDVAISGKGFFAVNTPEGEQYTRSGNFRLDATNRVVTQNGLPVVGSGGEIVVPAGSKISVNSDGSISANGKVVNKFRIVSVDPRQLERSTSLLFKPVNGAVATEVTTPTLQGGALEGSNVNAVRELTDMIMASKLFESLKTAQDASSKMGTIANEHLGLING